MKNKYLYACDIDKNESVSGLEGDEGKENLRSAAKQPASRSAASPSSGAPFTDSDVIPELQAALMSHEEGGE